MIVDTSALLAYFDGSEPRHAEVANAIETSTEELVISPFVLAELDYLVQRNHGTAAEVAVLNEIAGGAWTLPTVDERMLRAALGVVERYADIPIGLTDATNIVLAESFRTRTIATLDRRHFSVLRFGDGTAPEIVP